MITRPQAATRVQMVMHEVHRRDVLIGAAALALSPALPAQAASEEEFSFLVIGDWGRKGKKQQKDVALQMEVRAKEIKSQFVATVGDNFYDEGVADENDKHWEDSFLNIYKSPHLKTWYPALGNHDRKGNHMAQIEYGATSKGRWQMDAPDYKRPYYKRRFNIPENRSLDIFILDTSPLADRETFHVSLSELADQITWFQNSISASDADWKLVFGHHFLYSSGQRLDRDHSDFRAWLEPILRQYRVQAYISGHDHHLEYREIAGLHHIISGGGSEGDGLRSKRPQGVLAWPVAGFTSYRITGDTLSVDFIDAQGCRLRTIRIPRTGGSAEIVNDDMCAAEQMAN